jgi:diguanylate cyclase (GGDEF)-like protein/PAS domain S-box-containing protein
MSKKDPPAAGAADESIQAAALRDQALLNKASTLQSAIYESSLFSRITTDEKGIIQIFNKGAQRMLGFADTKVVGKLSIADLFAPETLTRRAKKLSAEFSMALEPGLDAIVYKAAHGIEDVFDACYVCADGVRFPVLVSVMALNDAQDGIIGYLLISTDASARNHSDAALRPAGTLKDAIFNSRDFAMIATDDGGTIQIFNQGAQRLLGYAAADIVGKMRPTDLSSPAQLMQRADDLKSELNIAIEPGFDAMVYKARRGIEDIFDLSYLRRDGSTCPVVVSVTALRDLHDAIIGYLLISSDNTLRHEIETERIRVAQHLSDLQFYNRSLLESSIDALVATNPYGIITDVNRQMEVLTGCTHDELIGAPFKSFFSAPQRAETGIKLALKEHKISDFELTVQCRDGKQTVVSCNATTYYDRDRHLQGVFVAARDITEYKRAEQQLLLALHDKLTGLPTRQLFIDRLQQSMAVGHRTCTHGAVMFLDLDNFKPLNDTHGHDFGDLLLIEVARRLRQCAREMDVVARFGGDEFVVLLSALSIDRAQSTVQAGIVAEKIRSALSEPYVLTIGPQDLPKKTVEHHCSVSIGIALFLGHQASDDEVIKDADTAMYQAKAAGRNRIQFCAPPPATSAAAPAPQGGQ